MDQQAQVVIVRYDAAAGSISVNCNPLVLLPGTSRIFFALHTANNGRSAQASLVSIQVVNRPEYTFAAVEGCPTLFAGAIDNGLKLGDHEVVLGYTISCSYSAIPASTSVDPSIVLLPPSGGPLLSAGKG